MQEINSLLHISKISGQVSVMLGYHVVCVWGQITRQITGTLHRANIYKKCGLQNSQIQHINILRHFSPNQVQHIHILDLMKNDHLTNYTY